MVDLITTPRNPAHYCCIYCGKQVEIGYFSQAFCLEHGDLDETVGEVFSRRYEFKKANDNNDYAYVVIDSLLQVCMCVIPDGSLTMEYKAKTISDALNANDVAIYLIENTK